MAVYVELFVILALIHLPNVGETLEIRDLKPRWSKWTGAAATES